MLVSTFCNETETWGDRVCVMNLGTFVLNVALVICVFVAVVLICLARGTIRSVPAGFRYLDHDLRWILTFFMLAIHGFELADSVMILLRRENSQRNLHPLLSAVTSFLAVLAAIFLYSQVEKRRMPRQLIILLLYWPCAIVLRSGKEAVLLDEGMSFKHVTLETNTGAILACLGMFAVEVALYNEERYLFRKPKKEPLQPSVDMMNIMYRFPFASLPSKCCFSWLMPLLRRGYDHILQLEDLGFLPDEHLNQHQYERFNVAFEVEKARSESKGRRPSLWRCYFKTYWRTAVLGGLIKIVGDITGLLGPLSISLIVDYVETVTNPESASISKDPYPTYMDLLNNAYVVSVVILITTFIQSTCSNNFNHLAIMEGVHVRSALQSLVYRKSLCISSDVDIGSVVNHMSVDAFNVMLLFSMGHYIWAVPFKLLLLLFLLYKQLGYSALIGAACIYILSPIQYWVCTILSKLQKESLTISDLRIRRTTELLLGIKLLKLYGWEKMYSEMIKNVRKDELKVLKKDAVFVAINTFITQGSAILLTLVTFSMYSLVEGKQLTPAKVFSGLALFNQLTVPLYIIPFVIPIVINAVVSTRRLADFLNVPEIDSGAPWRKRESKAALKINPESGSVMLDIKDTELLERCLGTNEDGDLLGHSNSPPVNQPMIVMSNAHFTWDNETKIPVLQDINLEVPEGTLTIVTGPVGSGKSTLLYGMLGELEPYKGNVTWAHVPFVAYVPQKAWLLNATLKENILFGQRFDGRRYHQAIQACALQEDIDILPARDMTEIGERGVNLSGGQRQRVALARALYSNAKLVILDDPLSALDAHVAQHVFEKGIKNHVAKNSQTFVLVTHNLELLTHAFKVVVMENGKIRCQGSMAEIESKDPTISTVLRKTIRRPCITADDTAQERHRLVRMLTKQSLYQSGSVQDISAMSSLGRQLSHDPSCPLPVNDCANEDAMLSQLTQSAMPGTEHVSHSNPSTPKHVLRQLSWKRAPPMRLSSHVSQHADQQLIEEGDEDQEHDDSFHPPDALLASMSSQYSMLGSTHLMPIDVEEGRLIAEEERQMGKIPLKVYCSYMKACRRTLAIIVVLLFAANQGAKTGTDFWLTGWSETSKTYNSSVTIEKDDTTWKYLMGYAGLSAISILLSLVTNLSAQLVSLRSIRVLHNSMLDNIVQCPMRFFDTNPVGRIVNRFAGDMGIIDKKLPATLPVLMRFLMLCISAVLVDIYITPLFLVLIIPVLAVYYGVQFFFRCSSRELQRLDNMTKGPIFSHFSATLSGLTTIRAFREEAQFIEKMNDHIDTNNLTFILVNCANCWLGICLDYLGGVILFLAILSAVVAATAGSISPSLVGIAMAYTLLVPIYLNWLVRQFSNVEMYMSSVERVQEYSNLPIETVEYPIHVDSDWPANGEVLFDKVSIRYDEVQEPVLKEVTLFIKDGEKVGICGRTGSGKSSLVMGLFKMVPISEGRILVDGIDIARVPHETLRSHLSIIPQEPVMFSGTIRENLDPKRIFKNEELWVALEEAQLKEVVIAAGGLDGAVTDEGSNFSNGQRQLFCLARSLLRPSKLLVLDEATSSLDAQLDKLLQKMILKTWKESTILAIAHRVTSLLKFDRVLVLDAGRIVEDGSPSELRKRDGSLFSNLLKQCEHQFAA
ncbi:ATP-binding cassette sub-family C member 9-like [Ornithodoros turicata]|uniref:ATP-binding cassette sub-family C member 9-like n=1 Tax=Ornithodoros turicata TaxID=34597 RepID=UPI00313987D1